MTRDISRFPSHVTCHPEQMQTLAYYAILDEAGDTGQRAHSSRYLVGVAVAAPSLHGAQRVASAVRKEARKHQIRLAELKARLVPTELVHEGLARSLEWDWELSAAIVDKRIAGNANQESEELYRRLIAHLVERCVQRHPTLRVVIDKRYNNQSQRDKLTRMIENTLAKMSSPKIVSIEQADSKTHSELLLADYVAWAVFQKYERADEAAYQIIARRIVLEETTTQRALLGFNVQEKTVWHPGGGFSPFETE